jgi:PTH2 family peptidyl-tRNA hydrolase
MDDIKQVIVIRKDLKMRRGKEIAQGAHAAMAWMSYALRRIIGGFAPKLTPVQIEWTMGSFAKVVVQVQTEQDLLAVHEAALAAGLESHLITDQGRTEFAGVPTHTAVAVGPDYSSKIDPITRHLQLY